MSKSGKGRLENVRVDKRTLFKLAGLCAPALALAAAPAKAAEAENPDTAGLRKTDHVKAYLDAARL